MYELVARAFNKDLGPGVVAELSPHAVDLMKRHEEILCDILQITPDNRISSAPEPSARDLFKSYMKRLGLKVNSEFLLQVGKDDDFEIWTADMKFIGCSHGFMRASSYSFKELTETDWSKLFLRDPSNQLKLMKAIEVMQQGTPFVLDVTDWHDVKEIAAKKVTIKIRVKATALAFDAVTGEPKAIVGSIQIKPPAH